jgi:alditol oxidase
MQHNWSRHVTFGAARFEEPASLDAVSALVRGARKLRTVGSAHSFNAICDTADTLLSLRALPRIFEIDTNARTVTIDGGMRYDELAAQLYTHGWALHNMASLPHVSVAGAVATATHGSGEHLGSLATAVRALTVLDAQGHAHTRSRATLGDAFDGAVVHLGALGVVTALTLAIEPAYQMRQNVYLCLPYAALVENFDAIVAAGYSVSLFTRWRDGVVDQVWVKQRLDADNSHAPDLTALGATALERRAHPLIDAPSDTCTEQTGIPGPWHERLPHFRADSRPSFGDELQSEYFVAREDALPAMHAIAALSDLLDPVLLISEVREVAADAHWLSMCHGRDSVGLHFTWKNNWTGVRPVLTGIERALMPFDARPHWGKLFTIAPADVVSRYPRFNDFRALQKQLDPARKFVNAFVEALL